MPPQIKVSFVTLEKYIIFFSIITGIFQAINIQPNHIHVTNNDADEINGLVTYLVSHGIKTKAKFEYILNKFTFIAKSTSSLSKRINAIGFGNGAKMGSPLIENERSSHTYGFDKFGSHKSFISQIHLEKKK